MAVYAHGAGVYEPSTLMIACRANEVLCRTDVDCLDLCSATFDSAKNGRHVKDGINTLTRMSTICRIRQIAEKYVDAFRKLSLASIPPHKCTNIGVKLVQIDREVIASKSRGSGDKNIAGLPKVIHNVCPT